MCIRDSPKDDWMRKEYDDKEWYNGLGAWGAENRPYPIHSTWTDVYKRQALLPCYFVMLMR